MSGGINPLCGSTIMEQHIARMAGTSALGGDMRRGVTNAGHAVLNLLDVEAEAWADFADLEYQLCRASDLAQDAANWSTRPELPLAKIRDAAIEAAARLIDAIGEMDRCIAAGEL